MNKVIYLLIAAIILFSGCGDVRLKHSKNKNQMFQSVSEKQAILVQDTKEKRYCVMCGMDLVRFYKTSHAASNKENTKKFQYCSIHCLQKHLGEGMALRAPKVVDLKSLKFISMAKATYVVGSKKRGTMSRVSKYAFLNEKDAKKFQEENGGELMDYKGALSKAKEDFKHYKHH